MRQAIFLRAFQTQSHRRRPDCPRMTQMDHDAARPPFHPFGMVHFKKRPCPVQASSDEIIAGTIAGLGSLVFAATKPAKSREFCQQLAIERGYRNDKVGKGVGSARKDFMHDC